MRRIPKRSQGIDRDLNPHDYPESTLSGVGLQPNGPETRENPSRSPSRAGCLALASQRIGLRSGLDQGPPVQQSSRTGLAASPFSEPTLYPSTPELVT